MADVEQSLKAQQKLEEKKAGSLEKIIVKLEESNEADRDTSKLTAEQNDESISIQENVLKLAAKNDKDTKTMVDQGKKASTLDENALKLAAKNDKDNKTMVAQGKEAAKLGIKKLNNDEKQISLARRAANIAALKAKEKFADLREGIGKVKDKVIDGVKGAVKTFWTALKAAIGSLIFFLFIKRIPELFEKVLMPLLSGDFRKAWSGLWEVLKPEREFFKEVWDELKRVLVDNWGKIALGVGALIIGKLIFWWLGTLALLNLVSIFFGKKLRLLLGTSGLAAGAGAGAGAVRYLLPKAICQIKDLNKIFL
jgi:hypothetical protein